MPFAALRHRNFRLFWSGQCVSLVGTWMQSIAQGWLVLQLTDSPFRLGIVSAAQFLPVMLFSLYGGVLADRYPKRRLLLLTQSLLLVQAAVLAVLTWSGAVRYWHVAALALALGTVNSLDMPVRQSFVMELAGREDLMNAIALNSTAFNAARLVGPALAGLVLARYGAAVCFALNALSFLAVLQGIVRLPRAAGGGGPAPARSVWREIRGGAAYILGHEVLRDHLLLLAGLSIFAMNFNVLVPSFARYSMDGDARSYGLLMSCMGLGAMGGAFTMAGLSRCGPRRPITIAAGTGLCLAQMALPLARSLAPAAPLLLLTGLCMTSFNTSINSTLQLAAEDGYRGRVMSVYALFLAGLTPLGSLFSGTLAQMHGPAAAFAVGGAAGLACLAALLAVWYARWRRGMARGAGSAAVRADREAPPGRGY